MFLETKQFEAFNHNFTHRCKQSYTRMYNSSQILMNF